MPEPQRRLDLDEYLALERAGEVRHEYHRGVVACGEPAFHHRQADTLLDPVLIVEVLSPSTSDYDRGGKFAHHRSIPSLRDYLLVAQSAVHVEHFAREGDGTWRLSETGDPAGIIELPTLGCALPVAEIYGRV